MRTEAELIKGRVGTTGSMPALCLVTVVYGREVGQLPLQARSLAHFATNIGLGEILVLVNDVNEDEVARQVEDLRPAYGALAPLLRVVKGSDLLDRPGQGGGLRYWLRNLWTGGLIPALRKRGGWRGHDGWQMQQAMKLCIGRIARFPYILMLDAKNIFVAPVEWSDFIAKDGRPRTRYMQPNRLHNRWYPASKRLLGVPSLQLPEIMTNFTTPYCIKRTHLNAVVAKVEAQGWPISAIFCRPRNRVTEFMLINAYCQVQLNGVSSYFAPNMLRSYTVFAGHSNDLIHDILQEALELEGKIIGIHSRQIAYLEESHRKQIEKLMLRHGLFDSPKELWAAFPSC